MQSAVVRRGRPSAEDSRLKKEMILDSARAMFCDLGYRAVTMRDVADKAQVSTRTLYNRYEDKLSLFTACLDFGAVAFPQISYRASDDPADVLRGHAVALVKTLSTDSSRRLGMLVYREGAEFPELVKAAEANQDRYLVGPLAVYLNKAGLAGDDAEVRAKVFISMALAEWQRRISFRRPLPTVAEVKRHAALIVELFLNGARMA